MRWRQAQCVKKRGREGLRWEIKNEKQNQISMKLFSLRWRNFHIFRKCLWVGFEFRSVKIHCKFRSFHTHSRFSRLKIIFTNFLCNRASNGREILQKYGNFIRKNFHYGCLSLTHSLSSSFSPFLHHEIFFSVRRTLVAGKFFVSCLVKAQVRSVLKRSTLASMEKVFFRQELFSSLIFHALFISLSPSLYLLEIDDNLNIFLLLDSFFPTKSSFVRPWLRMEEEKVRKILFRPKKIFLPSGR